MPSRLVSRFSARRTPQGSGIDSDDPLRPGWGGPGCLALQDGPVTRSSFGWELGAGSLGLGFCPATVSHRVTLILCSQLLTPGPSSLLLTFQLLAPSSQLPAL